MEKFYVYLYYSTAIFFAAIIFILLHSISGNSGESIGFSAILYYGLAAISFSIMYKVTGSLFTPIGFHAGWNYGVMSLFKSANTPEWIGDQTSLWIIDYTENTLDGQFILSPNIISSMIFIVIIGAFLLYEYRRGY